MTLEQAGMLLDALHAAFPRTEVSPETVWIYARYLTDIEYEAGAFAVAAYIAEGRWFPTIGEIRARVDGGNKPPDVDLAFGEVLAGVSKWGQYRDPRWTHPAIAAAVGALTWREICLSENADALRAHFFKVYEVVAKRIKADETTEFVKSIVAELPKRALAGREQRALKSGEPR